MCLGFVVISITKNILIIIEVNSVGLTPNLQGLQWKIL